MQKFVAPSPELMKKGDGSRKVSSIGLATKKHVLTDMNGMIHTVITTPANVVDVVQLAPLLRKAKPPKNTVILADKGYAS